MDYEDAVAWIDSFQRFGVQLELHRIEQILKTLNNPQNCTNFIHVAGTNGKGSVCRFISTILSAEGYKTGVYLSPHLLDFRERFQVNGKMILKNRLVDIVKQIKPVIDNYINTGGKLTYFEVCTILGFILFADEAVDYAVIEVGLGGRLDATNVINPLVSVITNVSVDHSNYLGKTIKEIAHEKSGIIKRGIPVITAATNDALEIIKNSCNTKQAPLSVVTDDRIEIKEATFYKQTILFHGFFDDYMVTTTQIGTYQPINIALSIAVIEVLQQKGVFISKESIVIGIKEMCHPGRMQVLNQKPFFVVDGAHNSDAMKKAVQSFQNLYPEKKIIVIFGVMKDKNIKEMLYEILPISHAIIVTEPKQKRTAKSKEIVQIIRQIDDSKTILQTDSVKNAMKKALKLADNEDVIFGTGSLFTVSELIELFEKK